MKTPGVEMSKVFGSRSLPALPAQPLAASTNYLLTLSPQAHTQHTLAQTRKNRLRLTAFLLAERQHTK